MSENQLGDYLRARREQVSPDSAGLPTGGVRRVAGLRREEVAMLAGISADYYLRLEQGRDRNPSVQVLESLARVLQLDPAATDYLLGLAGPHPRQRRRPKRETVPPSIRQLLDSIGLPAFVEGRYRDVLAANDLATALMPGIRVGANRMRSVFLDPAERELLPDWEQSTERMVAGFRKLVGNDSDDPRFVELVGELSLGSERFRRLWARHDVQIRAGIPIRIRHPQVGELTVRCEKLAIGGADALTLAVHHAAPGSSDAEKLALLASLTSGVGGLRPTAERQPDRRT
jgi:transcriptional regulator with XRE-family HTH domain